MHLIVRDSGPGIPLDKHELVFQEFQQIDSSDTREYEGVGLGLAICKRLAELLDGCIWIDEAYQQGAEFHVRFPAPLPQQLKADTELQGSIDGMVADVELVDDSESGQAELKHVLLVEDDTSNADLVKVCLKKKHLIVTHAKNGLMAIDLCAQQRFDIILMDLKMPEMGGGEAIRILRDRGDETPIVVFTALAAEQVQENLHDINLSYVLHKPVRIGMLWSMLDQILDEQR